MWMYTSVYLIIPEKIEFKSQNEISKKISSKPKPIDRIFAGSRFQVPKYTHGAYEMCRQKHYCGTSTGSARPSCILPMMVQGEDFPLGGPSMKFSGANSIWWCLRDVLEA